jgi:hypothetical protein
MGSGSVLRVVVSFAFFVGVTGASLAGAGDVADEIAAAAAVDSADTKSANDAKSDAPASANVEATPAPQLLVTGRNELPIPPMIRIEYIAESTHWACTQFNHGPGGRIPRTRNFDYRSESSGSDFSVTVLLSALKPNSRCQWRPRLVLVCLATSCTNVAAINPVKMMATPAEANLRCKRTPESESWVCSNPKPNPSNSRSIEAGSTLRINLSRE